MNTGYMIKNLFPVPNVALYTKFQYFAVIYFDSNVILTCTIKPLGQQSDCLTSIFPNFMFQQKKGACQFIS